MREVLFFLNRCLKKAAVSYCGTVIAFMVLEIKTTIMSTLLYVLALISLAGWILGFFVYSAGSIIHTLLMLAAIAILLRIIRGRNPV